METRLGFQVIQIIQNEVISAANNGEVLVHCRVQPGGLMQMMVKSSNAPGLEALEQNLMTLK
jgi:hypothetical protein